MWLRRALAQGSQEAALTLGDFAMEAGRHVEARAMYHRAMRQGGPGIGKAAVRPARGPSPSSRRALSAVRKCVEQRRRQAQLMWLEPEDAERHLEVARRVGGEGKVAAEAAWAVLSAKGAWQSVWKRAVSFVRGVGR